MCELSVFGDVVKTLITALEAVLVSLQSILIILTPMTFAFCCPVSVKMPGPFELLANSRASASAPVSPFAPRKGVFDR